MDLKLQLVMSIRSNGVTRNRFRLTKELTMQMNMKLTLHLKLNMVIGLNWAHTQ